jgi:hypothetical protein
MGNEKSTLCACSFGMAMGIVWAVSIFFVGLTAMWWGYGADFVGAMGKLYIGYKSTVLGSFIGLVYGFVDFFVFGFLIAWVYNACSTGRCCMKKCD